MITVQTKNIKFISEDIYDEIVQCLQVDQITCPCGHCQGMRKYGRYARTVWFRGEEIKLNIQRVQCTRCGRTHAILLDVLVPYSRIPLEDQRQIIVSFEAGDLPRAVQNANYYIEDWMAYHIMRKYRVHWQQRLFSKGISLQDKLVWDCFRFYGQQFLQVRATPNILFSLST